MPQPGAASLASHRGTRSRLTQRGAEEPQAGLGGCDELQRHPEGGEGVPSSLCDADPSGRSSMSGTILERDPIAVARPALLALGTRSMHGSRAVYLSSMWVKVQCGISVPFVSVFFGRGRRKKKNKTKCWNRRNSCQSSEIVPQLFNTALGQPHVYLGKGPCERARREVSLCSDIISSSFRRKERLWAVLGAGHERLDPQPDLPPLQPNAFAQHPRLALPLLTSILLLDYVRCKPAFWLTNRQSAG